MFFRYLKGKRQTTLVAFLITITFVWSTSAGSQSQSVHFKSSQLQQALEQYQDKLAKAARDFEVSLQLAKDQRLSLNPAQISGCCGRLMCCLMYEHQTYVEARRRFPREGKTLRTGLGVEKVVAVDIWGERVTLRDGEGSRRSLTLPELHPDQSVQIGSATMPSANSYGIHVSGLKGLG